MARFRFRLEPVLDHRKRIEDERRLDLAAALTRVRDAELRRDDLLARRNALRERLRDHHAQMDASELGGAYAHCAFLDREITGQEALLAQERAVAEQERLRLIAATQDKRVLETLKQRRRDAFDTASAAAEQSMLDDVNARLFDRTRPRETPT